MHLPGDAIYSLVSRDTGHAVERARALAGAAARRPAPAGRGPRPARARCRGCTSRPPGCSWPAPCPCSTTDVEELLSARARASAAAGRGPRESARAALARARRLAARPARVLAARPAARRARLRRPALVRPGHRDRPGRAADPGRERPDGHRGGDRRRGRPDRARARAGPRSKRALRHGPGRAGRAGRGRARSPNETVLPLCRRWLKVTQDVVRDHDLVTMYDDPVRVIEMPESRRGVAVAYCDPPGPLERRAEGGQGDAVPTLFAVSPAPADWDERAGRLVLPRVQPAHAAEPRGPRGDARARAAARARAPVPRQHRHPRRRWPAARSSRAGPCTPSS